MSLVNVLSKLRFITTQLVHQSRTLTFQVPRNFVTELQQVRAFTCKPLLPNGVQKVGEPGDVQSANFFVNPSPCAGTVSLCPEKPLLEILDPTGAGDLTIMLKSTCKPKCPKKKKKKKKSKCKKKKPKCKKKKKKKKPKCKKKKKKSKCKKKKPKCKKKKKKSKCKKKKPKCKKKKKKKKKKCPKKPKCKKKPKCPKKKDKCKKKPKCPKKKKKCPKVSKKKCAPPSAVQITPTVL